MGHLDKLNYVQIGAFKRNAYDHMRFYTLVNKSQRRGCAVGGAVSDDVCERDTLAHHPQLFRYRSHVPRVAAQLHVVAGRAGVVAAVRGLLVRLPVEGAGRMDLLLLFDKGALLLLLLKQQLARYIKHREVRHSTRRLLAAIAVSNGWELRGLEHKCEINARHYISALSLITYYTRLRDLSFTISIHKSKQ